MTFYLSKLSKRMIVLLAVGLLALAAGNRPTTSEALRSGTGSKIAVPFTLTLAAEPADSAQAAIVRLGIHAHVDLHDVQVTWDPADQVVHDPAFSGRIDQGALAADQPVELRYRVAGQDSRAELVSVTVQGLTADGDLVGKTETRRLSWEASGPVLASPPVSPTELFSASVPFDDAGSSAIVPRENLNRPAPVVPASEPIGLARPNLTIAVSGRWGYQDKASAYSSIPYARVEIIDSGANNDRILGYGHTDSNGYYNITVTSDEAGGPDIYARVLSMDDYSVWVGSSIDTGKSSVYYATTPRSDNVTTGALNLGSWAITDVNNRMAWYIYDQISYYAYRFLMDKVGWDNDSDLAVEWSPSSTQGTFYRFGDGIYLVAGDRWDSDVILHEYGHFVMYQIYPTYPLTPNCNPHYWAVPSSAGCAWSEGWATFLQAAIQNNRYYDDTDDQLIHNDIELPTGSPYGATVEGAVAASLWDIFDSGVETWDALADGINGSSGNGIWNKVFYTDPIDVNAFEYTWLSGSSATNWSVQNIFYHHGIGSAPSVASPDSFEPDNTYALAKSIVPNRAVQTHNIHVAGDLDWTKFTATAGWRYTIATFHLGAGSDTVLDLYGTDGATLLSTNDNASGKASQIVWTAPSSGVYYLRVRDKNAAAYGPETKFDLAVIVWPKGKPIVFLPLMKK